jgi:guanine nucleotide-binding protein G(i) subunit alpha
VTFAIMHIVDYAKINEVHQISSDVEEKLQALIEAMHNRQEGIQTSTRRVRLKSFKNSFLASEAVTWLIAYFKCTKNDALRILAYLQRRGFIENCNGDNKIRDDNSLFMFPASESDDISTTTRKKITTKKRRVSLTLKEVPACSIGSLHEKIISTEGEEEKIDSRALVNITVHAENVPSVVDPGIFQIENEIVIETRPYCIIIVDDQVHYTEPAHRTYPKWELTFDVMALPAKCKLVMMDSDTYERPGAVIGEIEFTAREIGQEFKQILPLQSTTMQDVIGQGGVTTLKIKVRCSDYVEPVPAVKSIPMTVAILGASESGKSTLLKQLRIQYGNGYTEQHFFGQEYQIYAAILNNLHKISLTVKKYDSEESHEIALKIDDLINNRNALENISTLYDQQLHEECITLWRDKNIQKALKKCTDSCIHFTDNIVHFLHESPEKYAPPEYIAELDTLLHLYNKTIDIVKEVCIVKGYEITFIDVGGSKIERKKWSSFKEVQNSSAIIFCISLTCYDRLLYEDDATNRMRDTLLLFKNTVEMHSGKKIVVVLTLTDVLEHSLKRNKFANYCEWYTGENNVRDVVNGVMDKVKEIYQEVRGDDSNIAVVAGNLTEKNDAADIIDRVLSCLLTK